MVCVVPYNSTTYLTCKVSASRAQNKMKNLFFFIFYVSTQPNFGISQRSCKSSEMPNFVQAKCHENLFSMAEVQPSLSNFINNFVQFLARSAINSSSCHLWHSAMSKRQRQNLEITTLMNPRLQLPITVVVVILQIILAVFPCKIWYFYHIFAPWIAKHAIPWV